MRGCIDGGHRVLPTTRVSARARQGHLSVRGDALRGKTILRSHRWLRCFLGHIMACFQKNPPGMQSGSLGGADAKVSN